MLEGIKVLCHSSIVFNKDKTIYIDPFEIDDCYNDADIIMITHSHYDHYSKKDIQKVVKENTVIIIPNDLLNEVLQSGFKKDNVITVEPNKEYNIYSLKFKTIPAYNVNKKFHPRENNWIGYILEINGTHYYIAGDTDITEENKKVKCDVAFVPVGGTYTMNYKEAANLVNIIKPKIAVPIHYGKIVGTKEDATDFKELLNKDIVCQIMI